MFRYNMGSLMFGSFLIACIWIIRTIFEYINKKIEAYTSSGGASAAAAPIKCFMKCCRCCLDCCHRFVKYINENAYCQIVLTGENFCTAAINGFLLILKHSMCFAFTGGVGWVFSWLGKILISLLNTLIVFGMLEYWPEYKEKVSSPIGPCLVGFLISYVIAALFMSVYTTTGLALLHCLFADIDICSQLNRDEMEGSNRPEEMQGIVKTLAKPQANTKREGSFIN